MNKALNLLGLAERARRNIYGESIIEGVRNHKVKLVVLAKDASDNTKKKYHDKCNYYHVHIIEFGTIEELSIATGKHNRVAIGITDPGFSKKIIEEIGG